MNLYDLALKTVAHSVTGFLTGFLAGAAANAQNADYAVLMGTFWGLKGFIEGALKYLQSQGAQVPGATRINGNLEAAEYFC